MVYFIHSLRSRSVAPQDQKVRPFIRFWLRWMLSTWQRSWKWQLKWAAPDICEWTRQQNISFGKSSVLNVWLFTPKINSCCYYSLSDMRIVDKFFNISALGSRNSGILHGNLSSILAITINERWRNGKRRKEQPNDTVKRKIYIWKKK